MPKAPFQLMTADSKKLEYGFRMIYAGVSAFVGLRLEHGHVATFWLLRYFIQATTFREIALATTLQSSAIHRPTVICTQKYSAPPPVSLHHAAAARHRLENRALIDNKSTAHYRWLSTEAKRINVELNSPTPPIPRRKVDECDVCFTQADVTSQLHEECPIWSFDASGDWQIKLRQLHSYACRYVCMCMYVYIRMYI